MSKKNCEAPFPVGRAANDLLRPGAEAVAAPTCIRPAGHIGPHIAHGLVWTSADADYGVSLRS